MVHLNDPRLSEPGARPNETLLPAVVQDAESGEVLMLAWANAEALAATRETGLAHFWSRSRNELWRKGATSGHVMELVQLATDCDGDALLYLVRPRGPACHTGSRSCFAERGAGSGDREASPPDEGEMRPRGFTLSRAPDFDLLALEAVILSRAEALARNETAVGDSYTARLLADGPRRPAEKLVEEAGESAAAALVGSSDELRDEAADLLYHLLVLLASRGVRLDAVIRTLAMRHRPDGGGAELSGGSDVAAGRDG